MVRAGGTEVGVGSSLDKEQSQGHLIRLELELFSPSDSVLF